MNTIAKLRDQITRDEHTLAYLRSMGSDTAAIMRRLDNLHTRLAGAVIRQITA